MLKFNDEIFKMIKILKNGEFKNCTKVYEFLVHERYISSEKGKVMKYLAGILLQIGEKPQYLVSN